MLKMMLVKGKGALNEPMRPKGEVWRTFYRAQKQQNTLMGVGEVVAMTGIEPVTSAL